MEVNSVGPIAGPAPVFSASEHASRIAEQNQAAQVKRPEVVSGEAAEAVPQRAAYLPAAFAAAAHAQLALQASAFAAQHPVVDNKRNKESAVTAVDSVEGSGVSNLR